MAKRLVRVKLRLAHVRPPVSRAFVMLSTSTLGELHLAIQAVMPWEESHLHHFVVDDAFYVDRDGGWEDLDGEEDFYDQDSTTLGAMIKSGFSRFEYVYDMGDHWEHSIELSAAGSEAPGIAYPCLIAGARACPLEDSGGPHGHEQVCRALAGDLSQDDFEDDGEVQLLREWAGDYHPEVFDVADAQARLDMTFGNGPPRADWWGDWVEPLRLGERSGRGRPGVVSASLDPDLPAERFESAPFVRDAALMLRMLAEEPPPVTKTGNLSVKSVLRLCDAMGVELYDPKMVRSAADIPWIEVLHGVLGIAGLLQRRGRVIALTPHGMLLADPARRAELAGTLMRTRFEEFNLAYGTVKRAAPRLLEEYLVTLSRLRDVARDWVSITEIWHDAISAAVKVECVDAFAYRPPLVVELRLIQPFVEMGLLESAGAEDSDGELRYRCTPLLDEWVHFDEVHPVDMAALRAGQGPTIRTVLDEFSEEVTPGLSARLGAAYRSNADSLAMCLDNYGPNDLSPAELARWEQFGDDDELAFCDVFGPEHIPPAIGMYLTWFLPKKVRVTEDGAKKATRFATDLLDWLSLKGLVSADAVEMPLKYAQTARAALPAAARFGRVIREWCDSVPIGDDGDMIEDEFEILRVDSKTLWLASYLTGEEYGSSPVPGKVASAARAGMQFSGSIVPQRGVWRIAEVWTVYPE